MRSSAIVNRYVIREMLAPFAVNLSFFLFIFMMTKILDITNYIVNYRISLLSVLMVMVYSIPFFLQFVIPMSIMVAILLTLLRMGGDNEIMALKAGGVSIYAFLPPVVFFSALGCVLTALVTIYAVPWGFSSVRDLTHRLAASSVEIGLKERTFNDAFDGVMLYVNRIEPGTRQIRDIFIEDSRNPEAVSTVVAPRGRLFTEPENMLFRLRLYDGVINQVDLDSRRVNIVEFQHYDFNLDLKKAMGLDKPRRRHRMEMRLAEMRTFLATETNRDQRYYKTKMDYYKKFSIPVACLVLGLLALPLGYQSSNTRRSYGLGLGLFFFLVYYVILTAGWGFGESGACPPEIGMWLPNIAMGALALNMLYRTGKEKPLLLERTGDRLARGLQRFLPRHKKDRTVGETEQSRRHF